jgi:hypothetical protein
VYLWSFGLQTTLSILASEKRNLFKTALLAQDSSEESVSQTPKLHTTKDAQLWHRGFSKEDTTACDPEGWRPGAATSPRAPSVSTTTLSRRLTPSCIAFCSSGSSPNPPCMSCVLKAKVTGLPLATKETEIRVFQVLPWNGKSQNVGGH